MPDMVYNLVENVSGAKIRVIGAGGAGGNAVNNMIRANLEGVDFIAANTDAQALENSKAAVKIQIGDAITSGLGAGANPEVGRDSAQESMDELRAALEGSHMVFIAAGLGGGTGTGAAPVIAEICKEMRILTVGVVTKPFMFEGRKRAKIADEGLEKLKDMADTVITIPNDRLRGLAEPDAKMMDMFKKADEVLLHSVKGITDLVLKTGYVNLDFADVRAAMSKAGLALMGIGVAEGDNRAVKAAERALYHPLLEDISISGARGVLINITAGSDLKMNETMEASDRIFKEAGEDAEIFWGAVLDDSVGSELRVTLIATGIGAGKDALRKQLPKEKKEAGRVIHQNFERETPPPIPRGKVRDITEADLKNALDLDEPTYIRRQKVVAAGAGGGLPGYKGIIMEEDDLDIPTFMRKRAD